MIGRGGLLLLFGVVLTSLALSGACSHGPRPAPKDPLQGGFYTVDEMLAMRQSDVDRYCRDLQSVLDDLKAETKRLQVRLDSLNAEGDRIRDENVKASTRTREISLEIRDLRLKQKVIQSYIVKAGDTLRTIAATVYGDPLRWREIYEANRGMLGSEDAPLREGSRLRIPDRD